MNGVASYGHWGRPVLAFPAERGDAAYFNNPMDYVAHDWPSWRAQLAHHLPRFC